MKVLHVITSLRTGGAEKLMVDLLPRLNKVKGVHCDLLLFDGIKTPFYNEAEKVGIKIFHFGEGNSVYSFANIVRLRKIITDYDIIHTHNTSPQLFAAIAAMGKKVKLITTEHNTSNRRRAFPLFKTIDKWMYDKYAKIICISDQAKTNLVDYLNLKEDSNVTTIYNGIDVAKFNDAEASTFLSSKFQPGSRIIIMVGAFRPQKDQPTLIKALKQLPDKFCLVLVGDGECRAMCEALAAELGVEKRVFFTGVRSDIPELLKESDYIVMSSHYEGLSLSSVEGMSAGKPFLASDVDGLHEVVKDAGLLFPHGDAKTLAEQILKLDTNKDYCRSIASNCLQRAKKYDISRMAEGYLAVYKSL